MYCIIGAHRFMGALSALFSTEDVMYIRSEQEGEIRAEACLWNIYIWKLQPPLLIYGTLSSDPHYLNFLKQSLLGYGDFNVACQVGGVLPLS